MSYRKNLPFDLCALTFARDLVGIRESGHNAGPSVELLLRAANLPTGAPWCAAFVNAAAEYAQMVKDVRSPLEAVPLQGFVHSYYEYGAAHGWLYSDRPYPGLLFIVWSPPLQRYAHIGFVDQYLGGGRVSTIEGNSNTDGDREGREVVIRVRETTDGIRLLDWTRDISPRIVDV